MLPLRPKRPEKMASQGPTAAMIIRPRIAFGVGCSLGPGKLDLLRAVAETGSISAASHALDMSYERAWPLVDTLDRRFGRPVVERSAGGRGRGGARLTPLGIALVRHYEGIETARQEAAAELTALHQIVSAAR